MFKPIEYSRGIVIDSAGFVVGLVKWDKRGTPPQVNRPRGKEQNSDPTRRKTMLDGEHYTPGCEKWRWDGKQWEKPDLTLWIVDDRGNMRRNVQVFSAYPHTAPDIPEGWAFVNIPPPQDAAKRAVWRDGEWTYASTFLVLDADGMVVNAVLAHDPDDIAVEAGHTVADAGVAAVAAGKHVGIGAQLTKGKWRIPVSSQ